MKPTLRLKIIAAFMVAVLAALAIGAFSLRTVSSVSETSEASARTSMEDAQKVAEIENLFLTSAMYGALTFRAESPEDRAGARPFYIAATTDGTNLLMAFGSMPMSAEARALTDRIVESVSWTNKLGNSLMGMDFPVPNPSVTVPTVQELAANNGKVYEDHSNEFRRMLGQLREQIGADAAAAREAVRADANRSLRNLTIVVLAVCAALVVFAVWLSYMLVRRIRATARALDEVAAGDLTVRFDERGKDEVGQMSRALNLSVSSIHDVIHQLEKDADSLARLANEHLRHNGAAASRSDSLVVMATSDRNAEQLAEMADNLDTMISLFVTDREPQGAS